MDYMSSAKAAKSYATTVGRVADDLLDGELDGWMGFEVGEEQMTGKSKRGIAPKLC